MNHYPKITLLLMAVLTLVSCSIESSDFPSPGYVEASFNLLQEEMTETKGVISSSVGVNEIRSWTVAAYDGSGNLAAQSKGEDCTSAHISLESDTSYDLYFLVNCPDVSFPDTSDELDDLAVTVSSAEQMAQDGLPGCAKLSSYTPKTSSVSVQLKRLVCCIKLTVSETGLSEMKLRKVTVCNAPAGVYPFGSAVYNESLESFDYTSDKLQTLGYGRELTLYCLENLRGIISNSDPKKKIPSSMSDEQVAYATYIDVEADVTGRVEGNVHYRIYPGANTTSDFNLRRSYQYNIGLSLSCSELLRGCLSPYWKIDVSGVDSVKKMSRHWENYGGYFWYAGGWDTDRLVIENALGDLKYTIITAEDPNMDEGTYTYGPYYSGSTETLVSGGSSFSFSFEDDCVDVWLEEEDEGYWWWIRATNVNDGSTVIAPIYQDGQSPISLDFQADRSVSDIYVGQSCTVEAVGPITDISGVEWIVDGDDGIVELEYENGSKSNRIMCLSPGTVRIRARYGEDYSDWTAITVKLPTLDIAGTLNLYEDGKGVQLLPRYRRTDGSAIYQDEFDRDLFDMLLRPLDFTWTSGSQPSIIEATFSEAEEASAGNSYADWTFFLNDVREPGVIDRMTVTNPSGCTSVVDVACRIPFILTLPKVLGELDNYYYLQGARRTDPLEVPYVILTTEAGDFSNVTITDGSGMFDYQFCQHGDGYRLKSIDLKDAAFDIDPDCCGDVSVRLYVRNRYSGRTYQSPAVYNFSVRLHLAVVMRLYSERWANGNGNFWYLTPCWYMPEGCSENPYTQLSTEIIQWRTYASGTDPTPAYCLVEKHFDDYQIGGNVENLLRMHSMSSLTAYTDGQLFLSTFNDYDLAVWWISDPTNKYITGHYKSFRGGTMSLLDCPEIRKDIVVHDFTTSMAY